ncbi:type II secretion system F family protein [Pseudonocardia abyssalis]|uniref:Type II secretion system F family protein n=1 Tax=Pseudonocardia abyssalis TaxID=2792008 RepID=A0ABS6URX6_9PSEU|nr:type II secretion system F family protein [Pseudonocardia abyssalis]MBW0113816.1 type II secretion system F family protein [Pseudonocardia abyssalis]MBW0134942.1 type II secretion system F family protein [Pseudonocardia abyssalis]
MSATELAAALAGGLLPVAVIVLITAFRGGDVERRMPGPAAPGMQALDRIRRATANSQTRRRAAVSCLLGLAVWAASGWPVAGMATTIAGMLLPWLLGGGLVVENRLATLEALEGWCRRMGDMLAGGGAIGLAQAVIVSAERTDGPIGSAVRVLARNLRNGDTEPSEALRGFADAVDDRTGDAVAAALLLALHAQSPGVGQVLRQLADGVSRDVRARRDIEAARAESRQSVRMLLIIQASLLVLLALVPGFAAPYGTAVGQAVMAVLLAGTGAVLVWMRRLAVGQPAPRFLTRSGGSS